MKQLLILALSCLAAGGFAQQDKTWRFGVESGFQGNSSTFKGGMETAHARFQHNSFGGAALGLVARYDCHAHWMVTTGLGLYTYGFEFALSENYSLLDQENRFSVIRSGFGALEIPTLLYYKFNPNCRNSKWLIGAGLIQTITGAQTVSKSYLNDPEGNTNANYLESESVSKGGFGAMLRFEIGRERVFKCGGILKASLLFNAGLKEMATSKAVYTIDGREYRHEFSNTGNFIGLRLTCFFKSFGK